MKYIEILDRDTGQVTMLNEQTYKDIHNSRIDKALNGNKVIRQLMIQKFIRYECLGRTTVNEYLSKFKVSQNWQWGE